jgi:cellulose synthase/poly-beta-1,6-N-acetylglucosamine synthase-like glycosyltransferase
VKVSIITPTTGNSYLAECIESVRAQTYENIEHIVVVDGKDRWEKAEPILRASEFPNGRNEHICVLPYATGTNIMVTVSMVQPLTLQMAITIFG